MFIDLIGTLIEVFTYIHSTPLRLVLESQAHGLYHIYISFNSRFVISINRNFLRFVLSKILFSKSFEIFRRMKAARMSIFEKE